MLKKSDENRQKLCVNLFFYAEDIVLFANNRVILYRYLMKLRKKLQMVGLLLNDKKIKSFVYIQSKIKLQFLGFDFLVMPKDQSVRSSLFYNIKNLHYLKKSKKGFCIRYRPSLKNVKDIKQRFRLLIRKILFQPYKNIYKFFYQINFILLGWRSYYHFSRVCFYSNLIDNFVFNCLRKILIKKFWYNNLLRPKWVVYNFLVKQSK